MALISKPLARLARAQRNLRYPATLPRRVFSVSSLPKNTTVGFVGLGNMGGPMALNLSHKYKVLAYDLDEVSMKVAQDAGIRTVESVEEIAKSGCSVIFTMLPGCFAVDQVTPRLLDGVPSDNEPIVFVDCSTVHPSTSRKWHDELDALGHSRLDAPVSGGVSGAEAGTLTFMVGCKDLNNLEKVQPFFDVMGKRTVECGGPGAGSATKLCNNLALATQMIGICEAMNLGESLGVDPIVLADVMNTSTAKCWSSEVNNPHPQVGIAKGGKMPSSHDYVGGFGARLMLKDLALAVSAGAGEGVALPLGSAAKELYKMADLRGLGDKDFGVMLQFLRGK